MCTLKTQCPGRGQVVLMISGIIFFKVILTEQQPVIGVDPWVDVNQPTTLTCLPSGTPRQVLWMKCVISEQSCTANGPASEQIVRLLGSDVTWGWSVDTSRFRFDKTQSNYPLTITSVTLEDEGVFNCQTNVAGQGDQSASAPMRIRVPPSSIAVAYDSTSHSSSTSIPIVAGDNHQFTCITLAVKPAATLSWTIPAGGSSDQPLGNQTNTPNTGNNNLTDSSNTVIVDIPKNPAVSQIVCAATNRQDGSNTADIDIAVTLQVRVPPMDVMLSDSNGEKAPGAQVTVNEGTQWTITCSVQGSRPAANIQWLINDTTPSAGVGTPTELPANGLIDTIGTWTFTPGRVNHRQVVKCVANTAESQQPYPSQNITLAVIGPPDNPVISGSMVMTEGISATLTCTADKGYPNDWKLTWSNGTTDIDGTTTVPEDSSSSIYRFMFSSILNLTPARDDNGKTVITCAVERNMWIPGRVDSYGPIDVKFCARTVNVQCPAVITAGNTATLSCTSESSNPETTLTWYDRNDAELSSSNPQVDPNGAYGGKVTMRSHTTAELTKANNGDVFKCCATNTIISCTTNVCDTCSLDVQYSPVFSQLTQFPVNPVLEGSDVILNCTVDANPRPGSLKWEKQDSNKILNTVYTDETSTLTLLNITREQSGNYTCRANNGLPADHTLNDAVSDPVTVIVHYEVNITNKVMDEVGIKDSADAVLVCVAIGNPEPVMVWYGLNNTVLTGDTEAKFTVTSATTGGDRVFGYEVTSNLTIKEVNSLMDYGLYTCNSSNGIGKEDSLEIALTGTRRPDMPRRVEITERTADSLTVTWTAGYDGGEEQSFRVSYLKTSDSTETSSDNVIGGKTIHTVTGLEDYTEYEIRVYAKNAIGENTDYAKVVGHTLPNPPGSETGITVEYNIDDGTVKVKELKVENSCIQLEVKYEGNDTWEECGKCIDADQTVRLSEWCAASQKRRRRAVGAIEDVRAKLCIDSLCSETASVKEVSTTDPPAPGNTDIIVGAVVGGVVLLAIIIALATYLVRMSPKDQRSRRKKTTDSFSNGSDIELQSPSNVAGPEEGNGIAHEGVQNHEYDELSRKERYPVYPNPAVRGDSLPPETGAYEEMKVAASKTCSENATNKVQENVEKSSPEETVNETTNKVTNRDSKPPITRPKPKSIKKYQPPSTSADEIPKRKAELAGATETTETTDGSMADGKPRTTSIKRYTVESGDTYAQVNKNLPPKPKGINPPQNLPDVTYASANKDQKPSLSPLPEDYGAKKKPKKYVPPSARAAEESAYEEVRINDDDKGKNPSAEGDGNTYDGVGAQQDTGGRTANDDGLIYVEVGHARVHPPDQPPIQTEPSTEYASLDFSRMSKKED